MLSHEVFTYRWTDIYNNEKDNNEKREKIQYKRIGYPENFYKDLIHKTGIDNKRLDDIKAIMGADPLSYIKNNIYDRDNYYKNIARKTLNDTETMILSITPLSIIKDQFYNDSIDDEMEKWSRFTLFCHIYNSDICIVDSSVNLSIEHIVDVYMSELKFLIEHNFI